MKNAVKKILIVIGCCVFLFFAGFICGYFSYRAGVLRDKSGAAADVARYDAAESRIENIAGSVESAHGNVRDAAAEIRISVDEVGKIGIIAGNITSGIDLALYGTSGIENGILRVMGILDAAEKHNAEMAADRDCGLD